MYSEGRAKVIETPKGYPDPPKEGSGGEEDRGLPTETPAPIFPSLEPPFLTFSGHSGLEFGPDAGFSGVLLTIISLEAKYSAIRLSARAAGPHWRL